MLRARRPFLWATLVFFLGGCFHQELSLKAAPSPQFPIQLPLPKLGMDEAQETLERFRRQHIQGTFALGIHLGPLGKTSGLSYEGLFLGTWKKEGLCARLALYPIGSPEKTYSFLAQQGKKAALWSALQPDPPLPILPKDWLKPLLPKLPYTAYDLLMPFIDWEGRYEKSERLNGRIAHRFRMTPPKDLQEACPNMGYVILDIDSGFFTLLKAELFNQQAELERSLKVGSFKKVDEQWMVKTIELSDHKQKTKAKLSLQKAALDLFLPSSVWEPQALEKPIPRIPDKAFLKL